MLRSGTQVIEYMSQVHVVPRFRFSVIFLIDRQTKFKETAIDHLSCDYSLVILLDKLKTIRNGLLLKKKFPFPREERKVSKKSKATACKDKISQLHYWK